MAAKFINQIYSFFVKKEDVRVPCRSGDKPDSEKSVKDKDKASVKVYTRRVGQEAFWDKKLKCQRLEELKMDKGIDWVGSCDGLRNSCEICRINAESCWDSMELEHQVTLEELGMDPQNKRIIFDFLHFVRFKERYMKIPTRYCRNYYLYDSPGTDFFELPSPGTDRSRIIAAMANYLQFFDIYHLDLASFSSLEELKYTLRGTRNRSIISVEGFLNFKTDAGFFNFKTELFQSNNEQLFVFTTNHKDQHTASLCPCPVGNNSDFYFHNSLLVSNSEKENPREAYDSTKRYSLPNFDATENKAVKVYSYRGRDWSHSMELEQLPTFAELGKDPENEGIINDLLGFVRNKEFYKWKGKDWKRGYLLYDSPGTDRSSLIAAMAKCLGLDIHELDLTDLNAIWKIERALLSIKNRSLIAIKDFDHWFGMHPNLKNEVKSLGNENELTLSGLREIMNGLMQYCSDQQIVVLTTSNYQFHSALQRPLDIDAYMHISSPQPIALPDGGEIVELDSSEQKPLVDFDATNNRAYQSSILVANSEKENTGETSKRRCMQESVLSSDDSTTRKSLADFDDLDYRADPVRAYHSSPIMFTSENKDMREGLNEECLSKSVLSDDDSTKRELLPEHTSLAFFPSEDIDGFYDFDYDDFDDGDYDDFVDSDYDDFDDGAVMLPNLKDEKWATRKRYSAGDKRSFQVSRVSMNEKLDSRLQFIHMSQFAKADESGPAVSNSEKGRLREALKCDSLTNTRSLNDLREHFGARRKDAAKGLCDSLALKSFEVLDSLPLGEQSNRIRNLARRRTLTRKHCVLLKKSQDLQQSLLSDCSGELAAQAALGLPDGGHIPSLPEKKIVRKTLKRKSRTMSVLSLEDHQQHVARRWEDDAKFLGAKRICRQLAIDRKPTEKRILRQHGTRRCQSKQSAIDLPDGGHTLSLSKKKILRKTLKRKYRNMSVLRSEYHQHVDSKWDDSVKSFGAKHISRQLVIHRVSRAKRIRRQHGFHRWPFQQNWATLKGYFLGDERPVAVISLSIDGKLVSRLQLIHISWLGRFSPLPPALPPGGEIVGPPLALSSSQLPSTSNRAQLGGQDRSGSTAAHSQNERTRDQTEGSKRKIKHFTIENLRPVRQLNRQDAAKELGVSVSTLKRRRQELGIMRWPPPEEVFRPPDGNGENNPPSKSNMLSANGQITMEIGMGGPNSEPNERRPNSFEDPNFQNIGNGSITELENPTTSYDSHYGHDRDADFLSPAVFIGTEAARGSAYLWKQGSDEVSDFMFPVYPEAAAPSQSPTIPQTLPHAQIASTHIPGESMGSLEYWRSFLAPPLPEGRVFGSVNCTIGSISDLAPSQDMPIAADTMESSENLRDPLASVVGNLMEENDYGSSNLIDPSCSNLAPSQLMQPTIPVMTPLLTERQDSRPVKLYATYGQYQIKLHLPLMPGIMELKQAVSKQLGLGLDSSFEVMYKDERGVLLLMTDDEEVRELLQLTSSENQVSNRLVIKVPNTMGFCGNCECDKCRSLKGKGP